MSVTHLAGPVIGVGDRALQRCCVCGEKLVDNKNQLAPTKPDWSKPDFIHWPVGCLVKHSGNRWTQAGHFDDPDPLPNDFCLSLVE